jgi:hypothetical protein
MNMDEHYYNFDLPFYQERVEPYLPQSVLDFHAHVWHSTHWKFNPWEEKKNGAAYMVTETTYSFDDLLRDAHTIFPGKIYKAVCFGNPTPAVDRIKTNEYLSHGAKTKEQSTLFPLMIAGKGLHSSQQLEKELLEGRFFGYKVHLPWFGNNYSSITIEDMLGTVEMELAEKYRLIVLLHVPRSDRLADPVVQRGVRKLAVTYPRVSLVLAHCGRCYLPDQMSKGVDAVKDLPNVYFDSSMVMDPTVIEILLEKVASSRFVFATDFPVPAMRGRRVYVADHWVDLVLEGYPPSDFRVQSNNIQASFMVYEIILAILRAAERVKLREEETQAIFHDNGINIINKVEVPGKTLS